MVVSWLEQSTADVPADNNWLSAGEESLLSGLRIPKRRSDWRLGRWTAKHAVASYLNMTFHPGTLALIEIHPAASGAPEAYFENNPANVSISLSHRAGRAACAVAPSGSMLGCDLELVEPRSEAFIADYFTVEEQSLVERTSEADRPVVVALLWSAKESVLKALRTGLRLDTRSISISLAEDFSPTAKSDTALANHPSVNSLLRTMNDWYPFRAGDGGDQVFYGWWQRRCELMRTVATDSLANPPTPLEIRR
jgi:4'-phosphopantetheinyl transferase